MLLCYQSFSFALLHCTVIKLDALFMYSGHWCQCVTVSVSVITCSKGHSFLCVYLSANMPQITLLIIFLVPADCS